MRIFYFTDSFVILLIEMHVTDIVSFHLEFKGWIDSLQSFK